MVIELPKSESKLTLTFNSFLLFISFVLQVSNYEDLEDEGHEDY
jgi:hypothetical protein